MTEDNEKQLFEAKSPFTFAITMNHEVPVQMFPRESELATEAEYPCASTHPVEESGDGLLPAVSSYAVASPPQGHLENTVSNMSTADAYSGTDDVISLVGFGDPSSETTKSPIRFGDPSLPIMEDDHASAPFPPGDGCSLNQITDNIPSLGSSYSTDISTGSNTQEFLTDEQAFSVDSQHDIFTQDQGMLGDPLMFPQNNNFPISSLYSSTERPIPEEHKHNPTARVLDHLDQILRDRVNLEIEEFRFGLQNLLSEQLNRIQHLVRLAQPSPSIKFQSCGASLSGSQDDDVDPFLGFQQPKLEPLEDDLQSSEREDTEKARCLLQLFTSAGIISSALRREEYQS